MNAQKIRGDSRIQLDPELLYSKVGEEIVLLKLESGKYYKVDTVGSHIWELIRQPISLDELCGQLAAEFDAPPEQIRQDVVVFLDRCLEDRLILFG